MFKFQEVFKRAEIFSKSVYFGRERITRALIDPNVFSGGVEQLSMFSPPAVDRLVEQGVPPRTAQKMVREEAVQCLARAL